MTTTAARAVFRLLAAWTLILAAVTGLGWLITHSWAGTVEPWDDDVSRWFADERTPGLDGVADAGTLLGDTPVAMGVIALAGLGFAIAWRSWRPAVFVALVVAGVGGFYAIATHVDPRRRPPVEILDPGLVPTHSFPSGHVGSATAAYGGLLVLTWVYVRAARPWVLALAALPVLVLLARLYQGAHHLSDVLTSLVYASTWLLLVARTVLSPPAPDVGRSRA